MRVLPGLNCHEVIYPIVCKNELDQFSLKVITIIIIISIITVILNNVYYNFLYKCNSPEDQDLGPTETLSEIKLKN